MIFSIRFTLARRVLLSNPPVYFLSLFHVKTPVSLELENVSDAIYIYQKPARLRITECPYRLQRKRVSRYVNLGGMLFHKNPPGIRRDGRTELVFAAKSLRLDICHILRSEADLI
jgi:hypothetical protein